MKIYVCLDKDNNVIGIIKKTSNSNDWVDLPGAEKIIRMDDVDMSDYNSKEYTKYELKDGKIVGKMGYEKKPTKSLRDEINELKEEINKLKEKK